MEDRFKVRLWDITKQKFVEVTGIEYYTDGYEIDVHYDGDPFETGLDEGYLKACFVEQCTGLRDKNGKLIYEGDILNVDLNVDDAENPENYPYIGHIIRSKKETAFKFLTGSIEVALTDGNRCEVIGNIHENPELLEVN